MAQTQTRAGVIVDSTVRCAHSVNGCAWCAAMAAGSIPRNFEDSLAITR